MIKKVFVVSLALSVVAFFQMTSTCLAETSGNFEQTKQNIFSLIDKGDYTKAELTINKLGTDFAEDSNLPETLYWLAVRYEWSSRPGEAKRLYEQVIKNYPGNTWTQKARLGITRADVISLVSSQNYIGAKEAIDKLSVDFSGSPDLPEALYWMVPRYEWQNKYNEAKNLCQQIIQKYPASPYVNKAKLGVSREEIMSLIIATYVKGSQDYSSAKEAVDKMVANFSGNPDLPESLYEVAERYRWYNRFEDEKYVYQQIIQQHIDDSSVRKAMVLTARANVMSLIVSGEHDKAKESLDKMISDFTGYQFLPKEVFAIGEMWYEEGIKLENGVSNLTARIYFEKAKAVFDIALSKFPDTGFISDETYFESVCSQKLGDSQSAIQGYEGLLNRWPDYRYGWNAQYGLGKCYQELKSSGAISETVADAHIEQAFKAVAENYPDHGLTDQASLALAGMNFQKGKWAEAAKYFEMYISVSENNAKIPPFDSVYNLASCYENMGDIDSSVAVYSKFLAKYPSSPRAGFVKKKLDVLMQQKSSSKN